MRTYNSIHINNLEYVTPEIWSILKKIPNLDLDEYSIQDPDDVNNLIQDIDGTHIYIHDDSCTDGDINPHLLALAIEQLLLYLRKGHDLLQFDFYPQFDFCIYTYNRIWEEDFEKFQETPNGTYNWDNKPAAFNDPNSNMQVQSYNELTHIATIYHYYTL